MDKEFMKPVAWIERYAGGGVAYDKYSDAVFDLPEGVRIELYSYQPMPRDVLMAFGKVIADKSYDAGVLGDLFEDEEITAIADRYASKVQPEPVNQQLLAALKEIARITGDAGFNVGGPLQNATGNESAATAMEFLRLAANYLEEISKVSAAAIAAIAAAEAAQPVASWPQVDMGFGKFAVGGCVDEVSGAPGILYLHLPEPRQFDTDCSDIFEVGSRAPVEKIATVIHFHSAETLQQTIDVLLEMQSKHYQTQQPASAQPVAVPDALPTEVVCMLIWLAQTVVIAMDDSEEREGEDGRIHVIDAANFDAISDALDDLEELPDDKPGYTLNAAGKAEWALRALLSAAQKQEGV